MSKRDKPKKDLEGQTVMFNMGKCCEAGDFGDGHECRKKPGEIAFVAAEAGVPDAHGHVYSKEALSQMAEQVNNAPILAAHGMIGEAEAARLHGGRLEMRGTCDPKDIEERPDGTRVVHDLQLHSISVIPADRLVDPRCRFVPAEETGMGIKETETRGYLSDSEFSELESAVLRAKAMFDPEMHSRLTRALWELGNLRKLSDDLLSHASASGLVEHARTLGSREKKE